MTTVKQHAQAWHTFLWSRTRKLRRMWVRTCTVCEWEIAALMMDFLRIETVLLNTLRWFFPFISIERNVQMESIFEVSTTTWFNGYDFSWCFFCSVLAHRSLLRIRNEFFAWSSYFMHGIFPLSEHITTILYVTVMFVLIWFIWMEVAMYVVFTLALAPYCRFEWGKTPSKFEIFDFFH